MSWVEGEPKKEVNWYAGRQYDADTNHAKEVLKYPEFKGNVKTIDARPFWRDASVSPTGAGYHYNHNAETQMEVGTALGRAMAELLEGKQ